MIIPKLIELLFIKFNKIPLLFSNNITESKHLGSKNKFISSILFSDSIKIAKQLRNYAKLIIKSLKL